MRHAPGALAGLRVATTRPAPADGARDPLAAALERLGASVLQVPLTEIERAEPAQLLDVLQAQPEWDWIVFTSATTVTLLFSEARIVDPEWSLARLVLRNAAAGARLAAIGPATERALESHGLIVSIVAPTFSQEGLLEAFAALPVPIDGATILYPAAEDAREVLADGLRKMGASVSVVPVYRSVPVPTRAESLAERVARGELDVVAVLAPSAVEAMRRVTAPGARVPVAAIGPVTAAAAREAGFDVVAEADVSTAEGLVDAIAAWWESQGSASPD